MEKFGLRKNPTFESLLDGGKTYELDEKIHIYNRAALNFRQGFFSAPPPDEEVVDEGHDDRHERVLAQMRAAAAEIAQAADRHRNQAAATFRQGMPHAPQNAHEAAAAPAAPPPSPTPTGSLGARGSAPTFLERMEARRKENPKEANEFMYRKDINRARQETRQAVDRNRVLNHKRRDTVAAHNHARAQQFAIDTPPTSRSPSPQPGMTERYDRRLLRANAMRNPRVSKSRAASSSRDVLSEKRQSASQIANKRPLPPDRSTLRKKKRTEAGDRGRQRNN
jgi:hypothetical protein